jgi:hypothetical protein
VSKALKVMEAVVGLGTADGLDVVGLGGTVEGTADGADVVGLNVGTIDGLNVVGLKVGTGRMI